MSASKPAKKIPPSPVEIVQQENPILRKKARELALSEIASPKIQKIIEDMIKALDSQQDGVEFCAIAEIGNRTKDRISGKSCSFIILMMTFKTGYAY